MSNEVKIMCLNEELKRIDDFFKDMSIDEFDNMLIRCGVGEIRDASKIGMELNDSIEIFDDKKV